MSTRKDSAYYYSKQRIAVISFLFCFLSWSGPVSAQDLFNPDKLHEIRITFTQPQWWDTLQQWYLDGLAGATKQMLPVKMVIDGNTLKSNAGIRFKGQYSNYGFPGKKKPFRVHFNKIDDKQDYQGIKKVNLHNLAGDPSFLREYISYDLFRYIGIPASRTSFTRLYINNTYWGCYLIVEEPEDKLFLQQNFGTDKGNLFDNQSYTRLEWKGDSAAAYPELKLQTKEKAGAWDHLLAWIKLFNTYFGNDFTQKLAEQFDIDSYNKILALDILLNNWDSYADNGRNFFIYDDPTDNKLKWIPWDYNLSMWAKTLALFPKDGNSSYAYKPLVWRIADNTWLRERYYRSFCDLLKGPLAEYPVEEKTRKAQELIQEAVEADTMKFYTNADFHNNRTEGVTVNMLRNNKPTDVWLPGITSLWQVRKKQLQEELLQAGCNCDTSNIADAPGLQMQVYPNPADNVLYISTETELDKDEKLEAAFYNLQGYTLNRVSFSFLSGKAEIAVNTLLPGHYFLRINRKQQMILFHIIKK